MDKNKIVVHTCIMECYSTIKRNVLKLTKHRWVSKPLWWVKKSSNKKKHTLDGLEEDKAFRWNSRKDKVLVTESRAMAAWARFEKRLTPKGHERMSAATAVFYTLMVGLGVSQLCLFIKTPAAYLKWVHFTWMQILPDKVNKFLKMCLLFLLTLLYLPE